MPALEVLDGEVVAKRTGRAIFETIDEQQLPDILLEIDVRTEFSEALLGHKAASSNELLACYAGLLAHGTEIANAFHPDQAGDTPPFTRCCSG